MVRLKLTNRELYVEVVEELLNVIYEEALRAYPFEGGGFLFGTYSEDGCVARIQKIVKSNNTHATGCSFERAVSKKQFVNIYKEEGLHYIGEWHSHTDGPSKYSGKDWTSMVEIAEYETTRIENPLLLIVSIMKRQVKGFELYMYDKKQLLRYEQD